MGTYLGSNPIRLYRSCYMQWPLEMWYMAADPGVVACPGHYSIALIMYIWTYIISKYSTIHTMYMYM